MAGQSCSCTTAHSRWRTREIDMPVRLPAYQNNYTERVEECRNGWLTYMAPIRRIERRRTVSQSGRLSAYSSRLLRVEGQSSAISTRKDATAVISDRRAAGWRPRAGEPCERADRNRGGASSASAQPFSLSLSLSLLHTGLHSRNGVQSSTHRDRTANLAGDPRRVAEPKGIARPSREQGACVA